MNDEAKKRITEAISKKGVVLHLSGYQLKEIPKEIGEMVWLERLNLNNNQITKIQNLDKLHNLQSLGLTNNQIIQIQNLDKLTALQSLSLSSNQINTIQDLDGKRKDLRDYLLRNS